MKVIKLLRRFDRANQRVYFAAMTGVGFLFIFTGLSVFFEMAGDKLSRGWIDHVFASPAREARLEIAPFSIPMVAIALGFLMSGCVLALGRRLKSKADYHRDTKSHGAD